MRTLDKATGLRGHSAPITGAVCIHHDALFRGAAYWLGPGATRVYIGCMSEPAALTSTYRYSKLEDIAHVRELYAGIMSFVRELENGGGA